MGKDNVKVDLIKPKNAIIEKKNKSCYFIIPFLGVSYNFFNPIINCYLGDNTNKPDLTFKKIFIHVKNYDIDFTKLMYFNHSYKLEDNTYMLVYDIPEQFEDDYIKFCDGQYSKFSQLAKDLICDKSGIRPVIDSLVYKVMYKTKDQKNLIEELIGQKLKDEYEVYSRPNLDKEVYNGSLNIFLNNKLKVEEGL